MRPSTVESLVMLCSNHPRAAAAVAEAADSVAALAFAVHQVIIVSLAGTAVALLLLRLLPPPLTSASLSPMTLSFGLLANLPPNFCHRS